jgi:hypothetical protein
VFAARGMVLIAAESQGNPGPSVDKHPQSDCLP